MAAGPTPAPLQVDDLKATLAIQEAELKQKNENADKLIQVVGVETEKVSKEKAVADEEEIKVEIINKVGLSKSRGCGPQLQESPPTTISTHVPLRELEERRSWGVGDGTAGRALALHAASLDSILTAP